MRICLDRPFKGGGQGGHGREIRETGIEGGTQCHAIRLRRAEGISRMDGQDAKVDLFISERAKSGIHGCWHSTTEPRPAQGMAAFYGLVVV